MTESRENNDLALFLSHNNNDDAEQNPFHADLPKMKLIASVVSYMKVLCDVVRRKTTRGRRRRRIAQHK